MEHHLLHALDELYKCSDVLPDEYYRQMCHALKVLYHYGRQPGLSRERRWKRRAALKALRVMMDSLHHLHCVLQKRACTKKT